jgi:hypothetical protein
MESEIVAADVRSVAKKSHPDLGRETEAMQIVNDAAERLRRYVASNTEVENAPDTER